jgi:twitching motility protein PilT
VGCFELLVCTQAVSNLVRESKLSQVVGLMQTGRDIGQKTFDAALLELVQAGEIDAEDAFVRAQNKEPFRAFLKQAEGAGEMQAQERRR